MRLMALTFALASPAFAYAEPAQLKPNVGDTFEITRNIVSSQRTDDGSSSGSSSDRDTMQERVIAAREDGLELEYDLPKSATAQDRARTWQFPARVLKPLHGPLQLLNGTEMDARLDSWLKKAKLTRAACGRSYFTWNVFRIECDPQSVIQTLEQIDLAVDDLRDGVLYDSPKAPEPAPLRQKAVRSDGATFVVDLTVDPEAARLERAQSDVVVAEISGKSLTLDAALSARSAEEISGAITITFEADIAGAVYKRTTVTSLKIKSPDEKVETQIITEIIERRLVARLHS
jgi:hypothetical protein